MNGLPLVLGAVAALVAAGRVKRGSFNHAGLEDWPYALLLELVEEKARFDGRMTQMFPDMDEEMRQSVETVEREIERWLDFHEAPYAWMTRWENGLLTREIEAFLRKDMTPMETRALLRQRRTAR